MKLYIGGRAQGKLAYCESCQKDKNYVVFEASELPAECSADDLARAAGREGRVIINHLHEWVRTCVGNKIDPRDVFASWNSIYPSLELICDEVGNGIVPTDPFEREWREAVGRLLIAAAREAESVVRVVCGLPQKIK